MKNFTTPIFLFFIKKYNGTSGNFTHAIFHFYRFLALNTEIKEKRMFWIYGSNGTIVDDEEKNTLRNLLHHQLINHKYEITESGNDFLSKFLASNEEMRTIFEDFPNHYMDESYKDKSCYLENYDFPVACQLCTDRTCEDASITKKDVLNLINFKGFPTPHKKIVYKNPLFQ